MFMSRDHKVRQEGVKKRKKKKKKKKAGVVLITDSEETEVSIAGELDEKLTVVAADDEKEGLQNGGEKSSDSSISKECCDSNMQVSSRSENKDFPSLSLALLPKTGEEYCGPTENTTTFDQTDSIEQLVRGERVDHVEVAGLEFRTSSDHIRTVDERKTDRLQVGSDSLTESTENVLLETENVSLKHALIQPDDSDFQSSVDGSAERLAVADDSSKESTENLHFTTDDGHNLLQSIDSDHIPKATDLASENSTDISSDKRTSKSDENYVYLATFECGTPKQIDDPSELWKDRRDSTASYDGQEYNFIPGIHKENEKLSRSSSVGSFSGSGSFSIQRANSDAANRTSTVSSVNRISSSVKSSSGMSDSWKAVNDFFTSTSRNSSFLEGGSVKSDDSFSGFDMFDDLLGVEEDHFSSPEVRS